MLYTTQNWSHKDTIFLIKYHYGFHSTNMVLLQADLQHRELDKAIQFVRLYLFCSLIHLFADDAKLSLPINGIFGCIWLQLDIDRVSQHLNVHCLQLNVKKSNSITFYRNKSVIPFVYTINGLIIERVEQIKDLGVILDRSLTFSNHIENIITKAKSRLAWIRPMGNKAVIYDICGADSGDLLKCGHRVSHIKLER